MGFQTTVIIRNDGLGEIRRNPAEFVNNLCDVIEFVANGSDRRIGESGCDFGAGNHANPARVIEVHHSDSTVLVAAGGATARIIGTIINKWRWPDWKAMRKDFVMAVIDNITQ